MCLHLVALATIFILPKLLEGEKRAPKTSAVTSSQPLSTNHTNHSEIHQNSNRKDLIETKLRRGESNVETENDDGNNNSCSSSSSSSSNGDSVRSPTMANNDTNYLLKDLINNQRIKEESENLQALIKEKIENGPRNIGDIFGKTVNGIVELKEDLLRLSDNNEFYANNSTGLRKRKEENHSSDKFLKKEIDAINAAVQQSKLPAVLSNGHAAK